MSMYDVQSEHSFDVFILCMYIPPKCYVHFRGSTTCTYCKAISPPSPTCRKIPVLDSSPSHRQQSPSYQRGLDSLTSCLDAMFQSKIIEARKYVPSVIQALKSGILSEELVPCLVDRFLQYGVLLSSEQFDLVVKLLNSALVDQQSAMMLLPLTTVIYRVSTVDPHISKLHGTCQFGYVRYVKLIQLRGFGNSI